MLIAALDAPRKPVAEIDYALLWGILLLLFGGLVMVYSSSIATAEGSRFTNNQPAYYLVRHGVFMCVGLIAAAVAFQIPLTLWQKYAPWLFLIGVALLAIVLIPGLGRDVNGARRWLPLGFANLQPSELMKLFAVLYTADYTVRKINVMHDLKQAFLPMFGAMALVGMLLLKEPDFGAFVVIITVAMGILFLGGLKARLFALLTVGLLIAFAILIVVSPYRRDRILGFMDPWADAYGDGYQLSHSLIAFGRGEWFGVGLGGSVEKLFYLPEAHTDFLLAVIAEELGFFGVLAVVLLFALVVQRAFAIGRRCVQLDRLYPALVAMGIGIWIGVQSFINMGVNMGVLPTKGLTLPLMSFGGSGILANCVALAILLRVDWENRQLMRGSKL
ncbi:MAG: putative lipid II flippase FtsW [Azonexus sp.]|jgi:cell division protein FtsW|nr:putative lipid II flippase FtsW [Azonexus sp.]